MLPIHHTSEIDFHTSLVSDLISFHSSPSSPLLAIHVSRDKLYTKDCLHVSEFSGMDGQKVEKLCPLCVDAGIRELL